MNYVYENLNDELFQELCQSLIINEFPDSQAFPIGQPDGGRDAVAYDVIQPIKSYFLFQVKFCKNPDKVDLHKWLIKVITAEMPKIQKLIPKGAKKFYLITNVKGTGR